MISFQLSHPYNTLNVSQIVNLDWSLNDKNNKYLAFYANFDIQLLNDMTWTKINVIH